ncbi:LAGLIDADG family homing endonuclease [Tepidibacter formicigenes]|jgi:hypothetical protein|uniref:LAGLIDADG-like domain-containing protein n=1 Tax=Tepidibacter formicigenes DSM 15518 TaxID=1123349 RepID=A0A1M6JPK5_9FIRM|nr:LAGLIDADG family homing endonuclease [Tepidibacter formicigenes]SHJ48604.1 LAGLIDADG-like domain-containing protein [Tepidibacter formicigenes DSM 15518]
MPRKSKFTHEQQRYMVEMYKSGLSTVQISKHFKCTASGIAYLIKKHLGELRTNKENSRFYNYNKDYFKEINNSEKAYWLGFIYADGYVKRNGKSKMFGIALSIDDKEHLEKFKKSIEATYPIKVYNPIENSYSKKQYCRIQIFGEEIFNNLVKHGVIENKTLRLEPPNIKKDLVPHFIRGYMDGDGTITYNSSNKKEFRVKIVGVKNMLNFIKKFIEENNIATINKFYQRRKTDKVYSIELGGNNQVKKFLDLIYKDSTIYLDRKYNRYKELCNIIHSRL